MLVSNVAGYGMSAMGQVEKSYHKAVTSAYSFPSHFLNQVFFTVN